MGDETTMGDTTPDGRVGFRDIYRAVTESESRVTAAIALAVNPISTMMADHEVRIRALESDGSSSSKDNAEAILALEAKTLALREDQIAALSVSRRRASDLSTLQKVIVTAVVVSNFIVGLVLALSHF